MGNSILPPILQYKSTRQIRVKNWKLTVTYWIVLATIAAYVVIYTIILKKGYQETDEAIGLVATKIKGTASVGDAYNWTALEPFDAIDLRHPPIETNGIFVATSYISTPQTKGLCNGNDAQSIDECITDTDCEENYHHWNAQGVQTGKCGSNGFCELFGWCPLEDDSIENRVVFNNVGAFTVFVRNDIRFPNFDMQTTNAQDYKNTGKLTEGINLFSIDDMLSEATDGAVNTSQIATIGAIILCDIDWSCDFDEGIDACVPQFSWQKLDKIEDTSSSIVSEGFNFRTAVYESNSTVRELKKLYGVRITFTSSGRGGRFSFVALTVTLGSGLAYLGFAKLFTDLVLLHLLSHSPKYREAKYYRVRRKKHWKQKKTETNLSGRVKMDKSLAEHMDDDPGDKKTEKTEQELDENEQSVEIVEMETEAEKVEY